MHWISPLAKAGLNILEASNEPEDPPAPIMVCSSSIKMMMSLFFLSSSIMALILSSNCPLYFVPATSEPISKVRILLFSKVWETFLCTIFKASPSAIADLPTPGSPIRTGLFFFLLESIWDILSISGSLPIIGSNSPLSAISVKSVE